MTKVVVPAEIMRSRYLGSCSKTNKVPGFPFPCKQPLRPGHMTVGARGKCGGLPRVPRLLCQDLVRLFLLEVHATFHYGLTHHLWVDSLLNHLVGTHGFRVYRSQYNQGFQKSRFRVSTVLGKAGFRRTRPCCWLLSFMRPETLWYTGEVGCARSVEISCSSYNI